MPMVNMKKICVYLIFIIINSLPTRQQDPHADDQILDAKISKPKTADQTNCWMTFNVSKHFKIMNGIEKKYADNRRKFHDKVANHLNSNMIKMMVETKGESSHNAEGDYSKIPSGLNLGGQCMVRRPESMLFFYRMKLRNNTVFRVNFLDNDIMNMITRADISLNDLHLLGSYERSATHKDPSVLFYAPTLGEVEVLLEDVRYKMQGYLRLQEKRFIVEAINSELVIKNNSILMTFVNTPNVSREAETLDKSHLEDFLERLKTDLDMWIKDYINDYFTYFQLNEVDEEVKKYEKARIFAYNEFSNQIIKQIKERIKSGGFHEVVIPKFTLFAVPNMQIQLKKGVVRGFDTIYRRSVATGRKQKHMRYLDLIVGFSNLKVQYDIDVILPNGEPPLAGHVQLIADDLTAELRASMVKEPEVVDLRFFYIKQLKPESLVVTGAANKLTVNYRHLLETHIISMMTNALIHNLNMLGTVTRCRPMLFPLYQSTDYIPTNYEKRMQSRANLF